MQLVVFTSLYGVAKLNVPFLRSAYPSLTFSGSATVPAAAPKTPPGNAPVKDLGPESCIALQISLPFSVYCPTLACNLCAVRSSNVFSGMLHAYLFPCAPFTWDPSSSLGKGRPKEWTPTGIYRTSSFCRSAQGFIFGHHKARFPGKAVQYQPNRTLISLHVHLSPACFGHPKNGGSPYWPFSYALDPKPQKPRAATTWTRRRSSRTTALQTSFL